MKTLSRKYEDSKVKEALEMYKDKSYKVRDIEIATGIPCSTISKWAKEAGIPLRAPKQITSYTRSRKCPSCGKVIRIQDAKYCPYCAEELMTDKERAIKYINEVKNHITYLDIDDTLDRSIYVSNLDKAIKLIENL